MKTYTKEEIEQKVSEIWKNEFFYDEDCTRETVSPPEIEVSIKNGTVDIRISKMYEAPGLSFSHLKRLSEFFDTDNINDDERFSNGGCETCDYGSSYGFVLTVRP